MLCTAKLLIAQGVLTPADVLDRYEAKRANVIELAEQVSELAQLDSAQAVMHPLQRCPTSCAAVSRITGSVGQVG